MEFVWGEVLGATDYLLRLPETTFLWENSLLGNGNKTSVEIPYSSLPFKRDTEKIPLKVVIEVWAYGNSKIIGNGRRYTNVGMYGSYTSSSSKRKISLFYWGKNFMFIFNLDPFLLQMSESFQTSTALRVRGLQRFSCLSFIKRAGGNR